jgi:hypothetical protein
MNQPWLRAGLIGAGLIIVVNLLGLLPNVGGISLPLQFVALAGVGILAASFMLPPRDSGRAAGQGALAGLLTGIAGGIVGVIMVAVGLNSLGGPQAIISQLPPDLLQQYSQAGVDPATLLTSGVITAIVALCCLPGSLIAGALLGGLGGAIYAAVKPK